MKYKASWIELTPEQRSELNVCVSPKRWRVVRPDDLPSVFPLRFRSKIDSALVIAEETSTGGTYLAYSANRFDLKDRAIDIELFGLIVGSTGADAFGVFIHHGSWEGRTVRPPTEFWEEVRRSGFGDRYLVSPPNGLYEGSVDELPQGHRGGFDTLIHEIRVRVDGKKR